MKSTRHRALSWMAMLLGIGAMLPAWADSPTLPVAGEEMMCSRSGQYCLKVRARRWEIIMYEMPAPGSGNAPRQLWRADRMPARYLIADDGIHYIKLPSSGNQLDHGHADPEEVIFVFNAREKQLRQVTLGQLIQDLDALEPTVSHFNWSQGFGFDATGQFFVRTVEDRELLIDVMTGDIKKIQHLDSDEETD